MSSMKTEKKRPSSAASEGRSFKKPKFDHQQKYSAGYKKQASKGDYADKKKFGDSKEDSKESILNGKRALMSYICLLTRPAITATRSHAFCLVHPTF
jgi:hypothetical protein